jgi:ankyrin repeat protein
MICMYRHYCPLVDLCSTHEHCVCQIELSCTDRNQRICHRLKRVQMPHSRKRSLRRVVESKKKRRKDESKYQSVAKELASFQARAEEAIAVSDMPGLQEIIIGSANLQAVVRESDDLHPGRKHRQLSRRILYGCIDTGNENAVMAILFTKVVPMERFQGDRQLILRVIRAASTTMFLLILNFGNPVLFNSTPNDLTALRAACGAGARGIVRHLLTHYPHDLERQKYLYSRCVLWNAVASGNCAVVELLLNYGYTTNLPINELGTYAVHLAARMNDVEMLKIILDRSPRPKSLPRNKAGEGALFLAVRAGAYDTVQLLIQRETASLPLKSSFVHSHDPRRRCPLHAAILSNNPSLVQLFLDTYLPDLVYTSWTVMIQEAVLHKCGRVLSLLLAYIANNPEMSFTGDLNMALDHSLKRGYVDVIQQIWQIAPRTVNTYKVLGGNDALSCLQKFVTAHIDIQNAHSRWSEQTAGTVQFVTEQVKWWTDRVQYYPYTCDTWSIHHLFGTAARFGNVNIVQMLTGDHGWEKSGTSEVVQDAYQHILRVAASHNQLEVCAWVCAGQPERFCNLDEIELFNLCCSFDSRDVAEWVLSQHGDPSPVYREPEDPDEEDALFRAVREKDLGLFHWLVGLVPTYNVGMHLNSENIDLFTVAEEDVLEYLLLNYDKFMRTTTAAHLAHFACDSTSMMYDVHRTMLIWPSHALENGHLHPDEYKESYEAAYRLCEDRNQWKNCLIPHLLDPLANVVVGYLSNYTDSLMKGVLYQQALRCDRD